MTAEIRKRLELYAALARDFVDGRTNAAIFQDRFISSFKADKNLYEQPLTDTLMMMFDEADCYDADPELLKRLKAKDPDIYLDENELRDKAREFVRKMDQALTEA